MSRIEYYFLDDDTFPRFVVIDGEIEIDKSLNRNKLNIIKFNAVRIANYDRIQTVACIHGLDKSWKKLISKKIKNKYSIETVIDKQNNSVKTTLQIPPKRPKFKLKGGDF